MLSWSLAELHHMMTIFIIDWFARKCYNRSVVYRQIFKKDVFRLLLLSNQQSWTQKNSFTMIYDNEKRAILTLKKLGTANVSDVCLQNVWNDESTDKTVCDSFFLRLTNRFIEQSLHLKSLLIFFFAQMWAHCSGSVHHWVTQKFNNNKKRIQSHLSHFLLVIPRWLILTLSFSLQCPFPCFLPWPLHCLLLPYTQH